MVAFCATTLQGATCVNNRCQYSHDVFHCKPCGRSFPSSLFTQHESSPQHLRKVASESPLIPSTPQPIPSTPRSVPKTPRPVPSTLQPIPGTPRSVPGTLPVPSTSQPIPSTPQSPPLSQSPFSDLLSAPTSNTSRPSRSNTPASDVGPRVTVSDEGGLDFVAEGVGPTEPTSFPSISHTILVEKTNVPSGLAVQSMKLIPSPNPWCDWFGYSINVLNVSPGSFVARLLGKTLEVQKSSPRKIEVSFNAPRAGAFQGALRITFKDKGRSDEEFSVTRELRGRAILPDAPASSGEPSNVVEGGDERAGVTVSHDLGLEFSVERSRVDEPFAKQTKELVIIKTSVIPLVSFKAARVCSPDGSVAR